MPKVEKSMEEAGGGGLERGALAGNIGPYARILHNLLTARVTATFGAFGLSPPAFSMIALIAANEGCSQNALARENAMDKSAVVTILDELEGKGLVRRVRSQTDRRRHALSLTAEGQALLVRLRQAAETVERPIREALTPEEAAQLVALLRRARAALEAQPVLPEG